MLSMNTMLRSLAAGCLLIGAGAVARADEARGVYLEARTCQVYTGPCFAAGEVGLAGKEAVMAWHFDQAEIGGVSLAGLNLVAVVQTDHTLGFDRIVASEALKVRVVVDARATKEQQAAMVEFLRRSNPVLAEGIEEVVTTSISFRFDADSLRGEMDAGKYARLTTRKANPDDCICSNESAYYPPLFQLDHFAPGVALEFTGRGTTRRWSAYDARSAYMGMFETTVEAARVAEGS